MHTVKQLIQQNHSDTLNSIKRTITILDIPSKRKQQLQEELFDTQNISKIKISYEHAHTNTSFAHMELIYSSSLAYLQYIQVAPEIQENNIATTMIKQDLIPYCKNELQVSQISGAVKSAPMKTVFKKTNFSKDPTEYTYTYQIS